MPDEFDDSRLDDTDALATADASLRMLASGGGRVRAEAAAATEAVDPGVLATIDRPRAVVAAGPDARLIRAVLEPVCPVPFVAWPGPGLPAWVGPLDMVVVMAGGGEHSDAESAAAEASRRGAALLVSAPADSPTSRASEPARHAIRLPAPTGEVFASAVVILQVLHKLGLGPDVGPESVASTLDEVAVGCSPYRDSVTNPAKEMAVALADALPLVWGGSVLAARAARRVVEALRQSSNRPALAANAMHLLPVLASQRPRDLFADPGDELRPVLVVLDDGVDEPMIREARRRLEHTAGEHDVRVHVVSHTSGSDVGRYAALMYEGLFAHVYLAVGLGRRVDADAAASGGSGTVGSGLAGEPVDGETNPWSR